MEAEWGLWILLMASGEEPAAAAAVAGGRGLTHCLSALSGSAFCVWWSLLLAGTGTGACFSGYLADPEQVPGAKPAPGRDLVPEPWKLPGTEIIHPPTLSPERSEDPPLIMQWALKGYVRRALSSPEGHF